MDDLEKLVEEGRRTGKVTFTSAEANKMLRMLNDSRDMDLSEEREKCTFIAATIEKVEDVRPEYDFGKAQKDVAQMEEAIRKLKHEINKFNVSTVVDGFDMTIDEMLVYIPQMTEKVRKLSRMASVLQKSRVAGTGKNSSIIEYEYANYDVEEAKKAYKEAYEELTRAQNALDVVNNTVKGITIDLT